MQIPKDQIIDFVRERFGDERAEQLAGKLPDTVDTDKYADLLAQHGVDVKDLLGKFGGGLGNLI